MPTIFADFVPGGVVDIETTEGRNIRISHDRYVQCFWVFQNRLIPAYEEAGPRSRAIPVAHALLRVKTFGRGSYVGVEESEIENPIEPIVISAPDGAYPGAPVSITGGASVVYMVGEYAPIVSTNGLSITPYQFYRNRSDVVTAIGGWFVSPATIPFDFQEGDILTVQDYAGNISNELLITAEPWFSGVTRWTSGSDSWTV